MTYKIQMLHKLAAAKWFVFLDLFCCEDNNIHTYKICICMYVCMYMNIILFYKYEEIDKND